MRAEFASIAFRVSLRCKSFVWLECLMETELAASNARQSASESHARHWPAAKSDRAGERASERRLPADLAARQVQTRARVKRGNQGGAARS